MKEQIDEYRRLIGEACECEYGPDWAPLGLGHRERVEAKKEKWIQKAIKKPGALKKQLGVPEDEPIPGEELAQAAKKGGKLGKRARLAMTLKKISQEDVEDPEGVEVDEGTITYGPGWSSSATAADPEGFPLGTHRKWSSGEVVKTPEGWSKVEVTKLKSKAVEPGLQPTHDTPSQQHADDLFKHLDDALDQHDLPTSTGKDRKANAGEFMLMHRHVDKDGKTAYAHFKHGDSRNYLTLDVNKKELVIPKTEEPFKRGEFDSYSLPQSGEKKEDVDGEVQEVRGQVRGQDGPGAGKKGDGLGWMQGWRKGARDGSGPNPNCPYKKESLEVLAALMDEADEILDALGYEIDESVEDPHDFIEAALEFLSNVDESEFDDELNYALLETVENLVLALEQDGGGNGGDGGAGEGGDEGEAEDDEDEDEDEKKPVKFNIPLRFRFKGGPSKDIGKELRKRMNKSGEEAENE